MRLLYFFLALTLFLSDVSGAGEYDFDIPEANPSPYKIGGRVEARWLYHRFDENSASYKRISYEHDPGSAAKEWRALMELAGSWKKGVFQAALLTHHDYTGAVDKEGWFHKIYAGYLSIAPNAHLTLDAGKKLALWGKGYAWNPAGFINPLKDPDDPALNLEGRTLVAVDMIKSFASGHLTNMGLTVLALPVIEDWVNTDMGENGDIYFGLKLYFLLNDTDVDIIYFNGTDHPRCLGLDFARNLSENIEVHGEWMYPALPWTLWAGLVKPGRTRFPGCWE
jgi:hypothetical protein